jgi:hypothetical protein
MQGELRSSRPDIATSKIVEMGLNLLHAKGRAFASEFLVSRAIPFRVIVRVLSDPPTRRRSKLRAPVPAQSGQ